MLYYFNPVLIAAAVIPAAVLLIIIYKKDRLEPEPPRLLLLLVLLGIAATFLAIGTETLGTFILDHILPEGSTLYNFLMYFIVVALSEEGFKYLFLKKCTWKNKAFNCQFDAVVYAVFVSLGFALWENVGYVLAYGLETAVIRALTAIPGHASFGVFMGAWYGMAKRYQNYGMPAKSSTCRKLALLLPVLAHGFYDFIASSEHELSVWIFVVFIIVMFIAAFILVRKLAKTDSYI